MLLKGFVVGIGKIIPGVSGSMIAMSLGIYKESLKRINHFFTNIKENVAYFFPLGLGICLAILLVSNILSYLLSNYYIYTMSIILGLLMGTIPTNSSKIKKNNKYYLVFVLTFLLTIVILKQRCVNTFIYENNVISNLKVIWIGIIESFTTITPGISGTIIYMNLGYYDFVLNLFANLPVLILKEPIMILEFLISTLLSAYLLSIVICYLLEKRETMMYAIIQGFSYSSLYFLFEKLIKQANTIEYGIILLLILIGIKIIKQMNKYLKKT